jgi:peptidyl-prolyl cis-trans isomerase C
MSRQFAIAAFGCAAALFATILCAADLPSDVLTKSSRVTITRADFDAELEIVPPNMRPEFSASNERLSKLMNAMLESRTLAAEARASGLDKDPAVKSRIAAQTERVLALARADQIEREAGAAFDKRRDDFLGRAKEIYLTEKEKFTLPEQVRAAHILIKTDRRTKEEALKRAEEVRAKALAPNADFAALAREYSDDQTAKTNGGNLGWFAARQMDRDFSAGAFALTKPGQLSEPVLSAFGYHIILLEARKPAELQSFDAVKDRILAEARREYVNTAKKAASERIFNDPTLQWNQPALDALSATLDADVAKKAGGTPAK